MKTHKTENSISFRKWNRTNFPAIFIVTLLISPLLIFIGNRLNFELVLLLILISYFLLFTALVWFMESSTNYYKTEINFKDKSLKSEMNILGFVISSKQLKDFDL